MDGEKDRDRVSGLISLQREQSGESTSVGQEASRPSGDKRTRRDWTQVSRVLGCTFTFFITWGVASSFSAYQNYYQADLLASYTPSTISWIGTVQVFFLGLTGIVSGVLYDRGYIRHLLVTGCSMVVFGFFMISISKKFYQLILAQGICIGIGSGMIYTPSLSVISQSFPAKQRPLAIGVSSSGAAIGGIILPILFRKLQPEIGFGWINRLFAFIIIATSAAAILLLRPERTHQRSSGPLFDPSALKEPPYAVLLVGMVFVYLGYWIPLIYISPFAHLSLHLDPNYAVYLLSILNAGSLAGRILPAFIAPIIGPAVVLVFGGMGLGILILGWIGIHNLVGITVWAILVGFVAGITVAIPAAIVPLLSPDPSVIGARTGMLWSAAACAALVGAPIAGILVNSETNDYKHGEIFGGAASLLGGLVLIYPAVTIARGNKRYRKEPTTLPPIIVEGSHSDSTADDGRSI